MAKIFCCGGHVPCNNYKKDKSVYFEHVKCDIGYSPERVEKAGLCWVFLLSGCLEVSKKYETVTVKAGQMFLLPSMPVQLKSLTKTEFVWLVSERPTEFCTRLVYELPEIRKRTDFLIKELPILNPLNKFLRLLLCYLENGMDCNSLMEVKQEELFALLKHYYTEQELAEFFYFLTLRADRDVQKMIEENCLKAKNVHELAEACGYTVSGFKRVFKTLYHESVYQWMLKQKSEYLKKRLAEEEVNLKVIIDEFGFSSPAHFTKFCKQWLGMVPTKYIETIKIQREHLEL